MHLRKPLAALTLALACALPTLAQVPTSATPATPPTSITSGPGGSWTLLKEGAAEGTIEANANHPANPSKNILRIAVTKYADQPKTGRLGAKSTNTIPVKAGQVYDLAFNGISEGIGVGIVVSLESDDAGGKVLARTTLPEIARGGRGGGGGRGNRGNRGATPPTTNPDAATPPAAASAPATVTPTWRPYLVSLTVRTDSPNAHLTITPIEPVPIWLDNLTLTQRPEP